MKLLKVLLLVFALVSCQQKNPFPTEETTRFLGECADNARVYVTPKALQTVCLCALDGIQAKYTYEQYTVMGGVKFPSTVFVDMAFVHLHPERAKDLSDPEQFWSASNAPEFRAIFQTCADKNWSEFEKEYAVEFPKRKAKRDKEFEEKFGTQETEEQKKARYEEIIKRSENKPSAP